jgi:hypothetical protein
MPRAPKAMLVLLLLLLVMGASSSSQSGVSSSTISTSSSSSQSSVSSSPISTSSSICSTSIKTAKSAGGPPAAMLVASASQENFQPQTAPAPLLNLAVFLPWLYFMANQLNTATLPKYVNWVISKGLSDQVSEKSATVYGNVAGLDAFCTFLSVNMVGVLSDRFGRKPFMFLSSAGLGMTYVLYTLAQGPRLFYVAAMIDGLTSCMLSQAQVRRFVSE